MNSLNKVQIIGNITREIELRKAKNGRDVCTVGVATNRKYKNASGEYQDEVEYHNIVCWGKLAEITAKYSGKGQKIYFSGRLQTRKFEKDGLEHFRTEIVADNMILLGNKKFENGVVKNDISVDDLPF